MLFVAVTIAQVCSYGAPNLRVRNLGECLNYSFSDTSELLKCVYKKAAWEKNLC